MMESKEKGYIFNELNKTKQFKNKVRVWEVNNTTEFKNTVRVCEVDIPSLMIDYALKSSR